MSDKEGIRMSEQDLAACIAAAEERGRRRGYGECRDDAAAVVDAAFCAGKWEGLYAKIQNLAPRDSAPSIPSVASQGCPECSKPRPGDLGMGSIEARQLRCPHNPRDSGKEG